MQCSTVVAWSNPARDPCEIKKKGLPFQLKFINYSQALSNMKGHRMQFLKGPKNMSWSMIGYNTVIGKTIKLSEGPKVMKNVTVVSQTLKQQKGRRLASTTRRDEKFQWRGPASWQNKNNETLILISLGRCRWTLDQRTIDTFMQDFCYWFPNALYFALQARRSLLTPKKAWWNMWRGPVSEQPKDREVAPWSLRLTTHY